MNYIQKYQIVRWCIEIFFYFDGCVERKTQNFFKIVAKPIIKQKVYGQVDLIDFQSVPDGDYKCLLNYQDFLLISDRGLISRTSTRWVG